MTSQFQFETIPWTGGSPAGEFEALQAEVLRPPGPLLRSLFQQFRPSRHGFKFTNSFTTPPAIVKLLVRLGAKANSVSGYGLCGGMSILAADYFRYGVPIPQMTAEPRVGSALYRQILGRNFASLNLNRLPTDPTFGASVLTFKLWMNQADTGRRGTQALTTPQFHAARAALALRRLVVLGLVQTRASGSMTDNHQVLAYRLARRSTKRFDIFIYDPNAPLNDGARIEVEIAGRETMATRVIPSLTGGADRREQVRGFFIIPFLPKRPHPL